MKYWKEAGVSVHQRGILSSFDDFLNRNNSPSVKFGGGKEVEAGADLRSVASSDLVSLFFGSLVNVRLLVNKFVKTKLSLAMLLIYAFSRQCRI